MNYPLISEYIEAIKSAEDNFEELSYLRPVLGDDGLPVMTSGNFAVVFKMKDEQSGKFYAVKCFTKEQEERTEAYREIDKELKGVSSPYLVSIRYLEKELFVDTDQTTETEFPVLLMDWVEGKTLDKYLRENLDDKYALEMLVYRFSQLAQWLIPQPFAHGDLKPDNILVREDGALVLVDYDGMYVPAMKGQKARELGSPDFRHPQRTENDFDDHIDDFPLATICLSLKAIALEPDFFKNSIGECGLLLNESDYRDLKKSRTMQDLECLLSDNEFCCLLGLFFIILSRKELDVFTLNMFVLTKPIKRIDESLISVGIDNNALSNNVVMIYNEACSMIKEERYMNAYFLFRQISSNPYGQNGLGVCYAYGFYVKKDIEKAAYWFLNAARKGLAIAQFNIGNCYYHDYSISKRKQAYYWYKKAAEQGLEIAKEILKYEGISGEPKRKEFECDENLKYSNIYADIFILGQMNK